MKKMIKSCFMLFVGAMCFLLVPTGALAMDSGAASSAAGPSDPHAAEADHEKECAVCCMPLHGACILNQKLFECLGVHESDGDYCDGCMAEWLKTRKEQAQCPTCRAPLRLFVDTMPFNSRTVAMLRAVRHRQARLLVEQHPENVTWMAVDQAVYAGNVAMVLAGLKKGVSIGLNDTICRALYGNHFELTLALLNYNKHNPAGPRVNLNAPGSDGYTIATLAIMRGNVEIVKAFLAHRDGNGRPVVDMSRLNSWGETPLFAAAHSGNPEIVHAVLNYHDAHNHLGFDVNRVNRSGLTALLVAVKQSRDPGMVQAIIDYRGTHGESFTNFDVVNKQGRTALMLAAEKGYDETVRALLHCRDAAGNYLVDVNCQDEGEWTALMLAACYKRHAVVELLLNHKAADGTPITNINLTNCDGRTALDLATGKSRKLLEKVHAAAGDIAAHAFTKEDLLRAASENDLPVLIACLDQHIDVNVVGENGRTALSLAAGNGCCKVVEILLQKPDIDVNSPCVGCKWTPLMYAVRYKHDDVVRLLFEHKNAAGDFDIKLDSVTESGLTILDFARKHGLRNLFDEYFEADGSRKER